MPLENAPLAGTWKLDISRSRCGLPPFSALYTYNADGSLTAASSVLGRNTESPGHGAWHGGGEVYVSVCKVFSFDEGGELAGVVRMRSRIRLDEPDRMRGEMSVDMLPVEGEPQLDVDAAVFEGTRIKAH